MEVKKLLTSINKKLTKKLENINHDIDVTRCTFLNIDIERETKDQLSDKYNHKDSVRMLTNQQHRLIDGINTITQAVEILLHEIDIMNQEVECFLIDKETTDV